MTRRKDLRPSDNGGKFASHQHAEPQTPLTESAVLARQQLEERYGEIAVMTLEDIVDFTEQAERLVARGRKEYDSEEFLRLAAEAVIHRIGEAISRLPDELIEDHPDVAWRPMRGTRNIVSHNYNAINHDVLWRGLSENLPADAARIRAMLGD